MTSNTTLKLITFDLEGGSVNRCFKTPVIIANAGCKKRLSRKPTGLQVLYRCGKIAALFLNIPTSRGDRPASPPGFSASRFSRNFSDLETPIYRAPLYPLLMCIIVHHTRYESNRAKPPDEGRFGPESEPRRTKIAPLGQSLVARGAHLLAQSGYFSSPSFSLGNDSRPKRCPFF